MSDPRVDHLDALDLANVLVAMCDTMSGRTEELTHADQVIGDGDHGLAMERGFRAARETIAQEPAPDDVGLLLERFGTAMLTSMGGASGPVYGSLFRRGAQPLKGERAFDARSLAAFLEAGLIGVQERGGAKVGDKTLVDALAAAAEAARASCEESLGLSLAAAAAAANEGKERTRDMRATMGRARSLGDRSIGHIDPGALSFALMLEAGSAAVNRAAPAS